MQTQRNTMLDHIVKASPFERPVRNKAIIAEEENGFGSQLVNHHVTGLKNEEVMRRIINMSVIEIIS